MVVFSHYPSDPRVRREAEALAQAGMQVEVICLKDEHESGTEVVNNVRVHRLPVRQKRSGRLRYLWEYALFILLAFIKLTRLHFERRYRLVHVHNMPDILILSALMPRLAGAKIILDLHDPMPELFITKYAIGPSHPIIRALIFLEKCSIRLADLVLTPNLAFRDLFIARGCPGHKIHVVMNSPLESIFCSNHHDEEAKVASSSERFVLMYHGLIAERHGVDTALKAIARVRAQIPPLVFEVYGNGDGFVEDFLELRAKLQLTDIVNYHGYVPQEIIARQIPRIDVGIIPNKKTLFTNINFPTRIFEYLCMGKPVIVPRTKGIRDYFKEDALHFFEPGDVASLAETILQVYRNPAARQSVLARGMAVYRAYTWQKQQQYFVDLIEGLVQAPKPAAISDQSQSCHDQIRYHQPGTG
jgi:glycosyltransferase involved in cell wall biosynthesis